MYVYGYIYRSIDIYIYMYVCMSCSGSNSSRLASSTSLVVSAVVMLYVSASLVNLYLENHQCHQSVNKQAKWVFSINNISCLWLCSSIGTGARAELFTRSGSIEIPYH